MKSLDEMQKAGCHFCKRPLTVETAQCGTMQIRLVGSDAWSEPIAVLCCHECEERHAGWSDSALNSRVESLLLAHVQMLLRSELAGRASLNSLQGCDAPQAVPHTVNTLAFLNAVAQQRVLQSLRRMDHVDDVHYWRQQAEGYLETAAVL